MEDELKNLPLRSVPDDYADHVMTHIMRGELRLAQWSDILISAQMATIGAVSLLIAMALGTEIAPLFDTALENLSAALFTFEQFLGDALSALNGIRIEPLEGVAPLEWAMIGLVATSVWLLANSFLIVNLRKEKLA